MSSKIQLRRDTAANWTSTNPVLSQGEPGLETDTSKVKYGDGSTAWNLLDYASGGSGGGAGDFSTGFTDGINDNTYHFVRVQGKKEFTIESEGNKLIEITLTAPMLVDIGNYNLTFTDTDTPAIANIWLEYASHGNSNNYIYKKAEFDVNNYNSYYNNISNPSEGTYVFAVTDTSFAEGDVIIIKYWTEGTTWTGSSYDVNGTYVPDVSETSADNTVKIDYNEFNWWGSGPGSTFESLLNSTLFSKHYLTFTQNDVNDNRNITNVVDNQDGTVTITFDGAPVQSQTVTSSTFTFTAIDDKSGDWGLTVPMTAAPTFSSECLYGNIGSSAYKYTGGYSRSGYVVINGGSPINFNWYMNTNGDNAWSLNMWDLVTYTTGDTIEVTYYSAPTKIDIGVYNTNSSNWNNGYKWFDWKDDLADEYNPGQGNGVMGGTGQMLIQEYRPALGTWEPRSDSLVLNFGWAGMGDNTRSPYDPYNQDNVSDWGRSANDVYAMYRFDEEGIVAFSDNRYWPHEQSITYKIRIIYRFDLIIGEDNYDWYC